MAFLKHFQKKKEAGFTLFELIIVLGIVVILGLVLFINIRSGSIVLKAKAEEVASFIKQAQNKALAAEMYNREFPKGGYGIYIENKTNPTNSKKITLFAFKDDDKDGIIDSGEMGIIKTRDYTNFGSDSEAVAIQSVAAEPFACQQIYLISDITGKVALKCGAASPLNSVTIVLKDKYNKTASIVINKSGSITVVP